LNYIPQNDNHELQNQPNLFIRFKLNFKTTLVLTNTRQTRTKPKNKPLSKTDQQKYNIDNMMYKQIT